MRCPICDQKLNVKNSRESVTGHKVWRRRMCQSCNTIFSSYERLRPENIAVIKSSGKRRRYKREKLFGSIFKTGIITRELDFGNLAIITEKIIDDIEMEIILSKNKEISTKELRGKASKAIKAHSKQMYLNYKSYYINE